MVLLEFPTFGQTTSLCTPVIELELEVRQRFGPLPLTIIRVSDASISSLYIYYDLCLLSTLIDYLTTQTNCWVARWDSWLGAGAIIVIRSHASYNTNGPSPKHSHIICDSICRIRWWTFLDCIIFCARDGPNPESGPQKKTANEGAESLS